MIVLSAAQASAIAHAYTRLEPLRTTLKCIPSELPNHRVHCCGEHTRPSANDPLGQGFWVDVPITRDVVARAIVEQMNLYERGLADLGITINLE